MATTTKQGKGKGKQATSTGTGALHPNPRVAKVLAFAARKGISTAHLNGAELCRQASQHYNDPTLDTVATGRAVRQVWRDNGQGVGRGRRHDNKAAGTVATAARKLAKQAKQPASK